MKTLINFGQNNLNNITAYFVPLTAALIICRAFPMLSFFYYAVPFILLFSFIFLSRRSAIYRAKTDYLSPFLNPNLHPNPASIKIPAGRLNPYLNLRTMDSRLKTLLLLIAAFGIWAAVTSAWSPFPGISLSRAAYFLLISSAPVIMGYFWIRNKNNEVFGFLLPANIIVIMVSIYSLLTSSPVDAWTGGHGLGFKGYASHQNALASAIVFTIPSVLFPLASNLSRFTSYVSRLTSHSASGGSLVSFYLILFLLNLYVLLISVSRAGILVLIIIITLFILLSFSLKIKTVFLLILISAFMILYNTNQSVKEYIFKTETTIGDRRSSNINETIEAAKDGGLFGLGYGISREPLDKKVIGWYDRDGKVFVREKMIGTLAIIEETGIIGMCLFLTPLVYVIWLLIGNVRRVPEGKRGMTEETNRRKINLRSDLAIDKMGAAFMIAVIIAFCAHAQIEAWWVGVGSIELPIFYLVIGSSLRTFDMTKVKFLSNEQN